MPSLRGSVVSPGLPFPFVVLLYRNIKHMSCAHKDSSIQEGGSFLFLPSFC